jgi:CRP-like cAMP-binding protein
MICNFSGHTRSIFEHLGYPIVLAPGEVLFRPGDPARAAYIVCTGELRSWQSGSRSPSRKTVLPGEIIGLDLVIARRRHPCGASALTESKIRVIPADALRTFLDRDIDGCLWALHFV